MKFCIARESILKALKAFAPICGKKTQFAILQNILIKADHNELRLYATDLNSKLSLRIPDAVVSEDGAALVSLKSLSSAIQGIEKGCDVCVKTEKSGVKVECGSARATLALADITEFPPMEEGILAGSTSIDVSAAEFVQAIATVMPAVAKDDTRKDFTGVWVASKDGRVEMVSTDGHRLNITSIGAEFHGDAFKEGRILSADGLNILCGVIGAGEKLMVSETTKGITFVGDDMTLYIQRIDGQFPDFSKVIPEQPEHNAVVDRAKLMQIASSVGAFSPKSTSVVRLSLSNGKLSMSSYDDGKGEMVNGTDCEYAGNGVVVGLNHKYLHDALNLCRSESVSLGVTNNDCPVVIKPENSSDNARFIVMPMQL